MLLWRATAKDLAVMKILFQASRLVRRKLMTTTATFRNNVHRCHKHMLQAILGLLQAKVPGGIGRQFTNLKLVLHSNGAHPSK